MKVSGTPATIDRAVRVDATDAGGTNILWAAVAGVGKQRQTLVATTNDYAFYSSTDGTAWTESFRLLNASGYAQFASRVGVGASPSYPLHVSGQSYLNGNIGVGFTPSADKVIYVYANNTAHNATFIQQGAASATVPVAVIRLGATPGAGGDALQVQNSSGTRLSSINDAGSFYVYSGATLIAAVTNTGFYYDASMTQTTVGAAGAASALPANPTGYAKLRVGANTYVVPYYAAA